MRIMLPVALLIVLLSAALFFAAVGVGRLRGR